MPWQAGVRTRRSLNAKIRKMKFNLLTDGCPQRFVRVVPTSYLGFSRHYSGTSTESRMGVGAGGVYKTV